MGATDPQPGTTRAHPPACKAPEHGVRRGWLFRVPVMHGTFQIQHTRLGVPGKRQFNGLILGRGVVAQYIAACIC